MRWDYGVPEPTDGRLPSRISYRVILIRRCFRIVYTGETIMSCYLELDARSNETLSHHFYLPYTKVLSLYFLLLLVLLFELGLK